MKKRNPFRTIKNLRRHTQSCVQVGRVGTSDIGFIAQVHRKSVLILWNTRFTASGTVSERRWHRHADPTLRAVPGAWYGLKDNGENDWEPIEDNLS